MSDDKPTVDPTMIPLREKLYETLGIDATKADTDEHLGAAVLDWVGDIEAKIDKRAQEKAQSPEYVEKIKAEITRTTDLEAAADEIREAAEFRRQARMERDSRDPKRKGEESLDEANRARGDILARVKSMQTRALSGAMLEAIGEAPSIGRLLQRPVPEEHELKLLQRANDDMLFLAAALGVGTPVGRTKYPTLDTLQTYPKWHSTFVEIGKALAVSDAEAWTPTKYSIDLVETVFQETDVAGRFSRLPWDGPGSTMTVPTEGSEITTSEAGESTTDDDDPKFTTSDPGVGDNITVTARTHAARVVWSYELEEDSIIPVLPHVRMKFVRAFARDLDMAILDGDADGTHQDTGRTLAAADVRKLFNGLRKKALADTCTSAATYFNAEQLMTPLLGMGGYGQPSTSEQLPDDGTIGIASWATLLKCGFLRDTKDARIGGNDAAITGPIRGLMGYPLVGSAKVCSDLNATGVYDGSTTTKTYLLWVFAPAWRFYVKADLRIQLEDRFAQGQYELAGRQRMAFQHMYGSSETTTRIVYGFADSAF